MTFNEKKLNAFFVYIKHSAWLFVSFISRQLLTNYILMKGNEKLLEVLNSLLADELTAINQYMVHSEMCENWGYGKLHAAIRSQAMDEMHHAEWLIERIIFFDGFPTVSKLNKISIGKTVPEMVNYDATDELNAVKAYNEAIKLAREIDDQGTVDLLTKILKMEEGHVDWAEKQRAQIKQMGIENYLQTQTESA
jgi:bacterioferritin